jgi:hypothetical protein
VHRSHLLDGCHGCPHRHQFTRVSRSHFVDGWWSTVVVLGKASCDWRPGAFNKTIIMRVLGCAPIWIAPAFVIFRTGPNTDGIEPMWTSNVHV